MDIMSKHDRNDYGKGYGDGRDHVEHEQRDGVVGVITDQINDPRHDDNGSDDYKEGFRDGRAKK